MVAEVAFVEATDLAAVAGVERSLQQLVICQIQPGGDRGGPARLWIPERLTVQGGQFGRALLEAIATGEWLAGDDDISLGVVHLDGAALAPTGGQRGQRVEVDPGAGDGGLGVGVEGVDDSLSPRRDRARLGVAAAIEVGADDARSQGERVPEVPPFPLPASVGLGMRAPRCRVGGIRSATGAGVVRNLLIVGEHPVGKGEHLGGDAHVM